MTVVIQIQNANIYIGEEARQHAERPLLSPRAKCPGPASIIHVNPVQGSSLGTIAAYAVYGNCVSTHRPPQAVYAQVYPYLLLPGGSGATSVPFPTPSPQQAANPSLGLYTWSALAAVDSSPTSPGAQNFFVLWSSVSGETPTTSDAVVQFSGVPTGGSTCSYGSSSGAAPVTPRELSSTQHLHISIPDGVNAGGHTAKGVAAMRWNVTLRDIPYVLFAGDAGAYLVIQGQHDSAVSESVSFDPFVAIFSGAIFGATRDIVVTLA